MTSEAGEEVRKPKKKALKKNEKSASASQSSQQQQQESEDHQQAPSATFTPYDYSQSDFKLFAGMMVFLLRLQLVKFITSAATCSVKGGACNGSKFHPSLAGHLGVIAEGIAFL